MFLRRTMLYSLTVFTIFATAATGYAQGASWLKRSWQGRAYLLGNSPQNYNLVLTIYNVKGKNFEGNMRTIQSSDTSVNFDTKISGIIYDKHLAINIGTWKVKCSTCKPQALTFSIESGRFFLKGEAKGCSVECTWITEFSNELVQFNLSEKETLYALANEAETPEPDTAILAQNTNPSLPDTIASVPQENTSITQRLPVLPAGTIVLSERNTALLLQKPSRSLQKTPSMVIQQPAPAEHRIQVLPAGTVILSERNTALLNPQKRPGSLPDNNSSLKMPENTSVPTQKPPPASPGDTISLLPEGYAERKKNVVRTLIVNTDSIILRVYDNGVVDGDIVSVVYNDQVVVDKLSLTARVVVIKIPVNKSGINTLVFHAHNLGEYPPNTARLEILYGNKREELTVSSDLTVSSTINIEYQQ